MKTDNLLYILETLAGFDSRDIDDNGDDFDVLFETECGRDTGATCSIVDIAQKTVDKINELSPKWLCPVEVPPTSESEMFWVLHPNGYIEMARFNNYTKYGGWRDTWQDLKHDDIEMKGTKYAVINKPEVPQ